MTLTKCQQRALSKINHFLFYENGGSEFLLTGGAGTGKTYIMNILYHKYGCDKNIIFTAPTHKAVQVLREKIECKKKEKFQTIFKLLGLQKGIDPKTGNKIFNTDDPTKYIVENKVDIVIVDEVSMLSDKLYNNIQDVITKTRVKFIYVGDEYQLPPVEFCYELSKPLRTLRGDNKELMVKTKRTKQRDLLEIYQVFRQSVDTHEDPRKYLKKYKDSDNIRLITTESKFKKAIYDEYKESNIMVLTSTNKSSTKYNNYIKRKLGNEDCYSLGDRMYFKDYYRDPKTNKTMYTQTRFTIMDVKKRKDHIEYFNDTFEYYELLIKVENKWLLTICAMDREKTNNRHSPNYKRFLEACKTKRELIKEKYEKKLCDTELLTVMWREYYREVEAVDCSIDYASAMTIHKSQGSTFENVFVDLTDVIRHYNYVKKLNNDKGKGHLDINFTKYRSMYTAVSRASKKLTIFCDMSKFKELNDINLNTQKRCSCCHCVKDKIDYINRKGRECRTCERCRMDRKIKKKESKKN